MKKVIAKNMTNFIFLNDVEHYHMVYGIRYGNIYLIAKVSQHPIQYNLVDLYAGNFWSNSVEGETKREVIIKASEEDFDFYILEDKAELLDLIKENK